VRRIHEENSIGSDSTVCQMSGEIWMALSILICIHANPGTQTEEFPAEAPKSNPEESDVLILRILKSYGKVRKD
jgi:hypothetical protein